MRGQPDPRVDNEWHVGEMGAKGPQPEDVIEPFASTDRRTPGHQYLAARLHQALGDDEILGRVRKDLEAVLAEDAGCLDEAEDVRLERVGVPDNLELDPPR